MSAIAPSAQSGSVLLAVKAAARRLRRWPAASLDCACARCPSQCAGRDGETPRDRTKKLAVYSSLNNTMFHI